MPPDARLINDAAIELGVDPAFVEKDWYATQVLNALSGVRTNQFRPVFCGGTSLSKAYKKLKRFSEDLDFRVCFEGEGVAIRSAKRNFKNAVFSAAEQIDGIEFNRDEVTAGSHYFKFPLHYEIAFDSSFQLRPHLQVEFSFTPPIHDLVIQSASSLIGELSGNEPTFDILCLSLMETCADKLSALTWRVIKRDRNSAEDDPAMIRHLHDLAALYEEIQNNPDLFASLAEIAFRTDMNEKKRALGMGLLEAAGKAFDIIRADSAYAREYRDFVSNLSYAKSDQNIGFDKALSRLKNIELLLRNKN